MNTRKKVTSLMGGAPMVTTVFGMTAGLAPTSAAPSQSPGANLTIVDQNITGPGTMQRKVLRRATGRVQAVEPMARDAR